MIKISPSILSCNFAQMGEEAVAMEQAGADMLHLDIMDGNFVPNLTFGPPVVASLRRVTPIFFDAHLMVNYPLRMLEAFAKAGCDRITVHVESLDDIPETLGQIRALGMQTGLSISPETPVAPLLPYLDDLDQVLVMTVHPGFGGQAYMTDCNAKIEELATRKLQNGQRFELEVDGGIAPETAKTAALCGAEIMVAGSYLFGQPDYAAAVALLRLAGQEGEKEFLARCH